MTHIEYFDTDGRRLIWAASDARDGQHIPKVGEVLEFRSCQAQVEQVDQRTYGSDTNKVIVTCKVLKYH